MSDHHAHWTPRSYTTMMATEVPDRWLPSQCLASAGADGAKRREPRLVASREGRVVWELVRDLASGQGRLMAEPQAGGPSFS